MANIVRRRPFRDLLSMRDEMDRFLNDTLSFFDDNMAGERLGWQPTMDLYENEDEYVAKLDMPGLKKDDININVMNNKVNISGEVTREHKEEEENYFLQERVAGKFNRAFALPTSIDAGKVQASFKDGVLELKLPKAEEAKPKQIEISGE